METNDNRYMIAIGEHKLVHYGLTGGRTCATCKTIDNERHQVSFECKQCAKEPIRMSDACTGKYLHAIGNKLRCFARHPVHFAMLQAMNLKLDEDDRLLVET